MAKSGATPSDRPDAGPDPALPQTQPVPTTTAAPDPKDRGPVASGLATGPAEGLVGDEQLLATFTQLPDELVSTLAYVGGNRADAPDAAQEAFLKCWRAREAVPDIHNLRAWIFRIGLNAAKDYQRSAWSRRSRPLPEDDLMIPARDDAPGTAMEDQE